MGLECGIDLIFKHHIGNIWVVQSKYVSNKDDISKAQIDRILCDSIDARIHGHLLIASNDVIGRNARQVINRQRSKFFYPLDSDSY